MSEKKILHINFYYYVDIACTYYRRKRERERETTDRVYGVAAVAKVNYDTRDE